MGQETLRLCLAIVTRRIEEVDPDLEALGNDFVRARLVERSAEIVTTQPNQRDLKRPHHCCSHMCASSLCFLCDVRGRSYMMQFSRRLAFSSPVTIRSSRNSPSSPLWVGAAASATSVPFSVVFGELACIVGAFIIARKMPELDAYVDEHAAQQ